MTNSFTLTRSLQRDFYRLISYHSDRISPGEGIFPIDYEGQIDFQEDRQKAFLPAGTLCGIAPAVDAVLAVGK